MFHGTVFSEERESFLTNKGVSEMAEKRNYLKFLIFGLFVLLSGLAVFAETVQFEGYKLPVVVTTYGQTPGALMIRMVCTRNKVTCEQQDLLTAEMLAQKAAAGNPYGTLENVKLRMYINDHLRMYRKQLRDQRFSIIKLL